MNEEYKIDISLDDNSLVLTSETVAISYCNSLDRQLVKAIYQLQQENKQLKEVIEEVREYIEKYRYITDKVTDEDSLYYGQDITMYAFNDDNVMELLQILDKVKD